MDALLRVAGVALRGAADVLCAIATECDGRVFEPDDDDEEWDDTEDVDEPPPRAPGHPVVLPAHVAVRLRRRSCCPTAR